MYSFIYSTLTDPLLRDIRIYTPEFSGMKAGDRVLDVCCGTGDQAIHYAKRGIIATGVDLSPSMIKLAERNKRKQGLRNVSFQIADAQNLPFENSFFDYASISLALHEVERTARDRIILEMKRVVKKEGVLIFTDYRIPLPGNPFPYLIKFMEFIAGSNHYRYFKDYIEQGGLDEPLKKNQLPEEKRDYLKNGLMVIIKARNV
jgi:ubiquinone/menaquinone biosynthesis C-methylase UbiE